MNYLAIFFLVIQGITLNGQNDPHSQLIDQFLNVLKSNDNTMECLFKKNIIKAPDSINNQGESSYKFYQTILDSLSDQLISCEDQEITYEAFVLDKRSNEKISEMELIVPGAGTVYLVYCNKSLITPLLIKDGYIVSFSTLNKGGKRVFLMI